MTQAAVTQPPPYITSPPLKVDGEEEGTSTLATNLVMNYSRGSRRKANLSLEAPNPRRRTTYMYYPTGGRYHDESSSYLPLRPLLLPFTLPFPIRE